VSLPCGAEGQVGCGMDVGNPNLLFSADIDRLASDKTFRES
jgi:hypothetical protein